MAFEVTMAEVWTAELEDRPGALAERVEALQAAGADLEMAIVRPSVNMGLLCVAPIVGGAQTRAAEKIGLKKDSSLHALRIVGSDSPGLIASIARTLADAQIDISTVWAAALGKRSALYISFVSNSDANRAAQLLRAKLG
jgi:hypothetical protein